MIRNNNPLVPHKFQDKFLQWIVDPKNTSVGEGEKSVSSTQHLDDDDDSGGKENDTTQSSNLKTKLCTELQTLLASTTSSSSSISSMSAARSQPTPRKRTRSSFSSDFSSPPASSTRKKMKMTPQGSASGSGPRQRSLLQRSARKSSTYLLSQFRDLEMTVKARGKCHRDVKPDNCVLFGGDPGCPVLIDLGEGSAIDSDGGNNTVAGAYEYRDHQMNEDGYDPVKTDLYSLALTTIAISTGVDEYENLATEEGWTKPTTKRTCYPKCFQNCLEDPSSGCRRTSASNDR
mmetsp:Transcript_13791/g.33233  ORF Transcript_13791/g.33233 Transcript_13791/m.33233 type:complete len:289 (-) Transcript_13791:244-1110(-)